ncbi:DUF2059 domain-containing protein [Hahella ganghwensis]|uniref:DUF2059 domain-containing protein n=1 Tax=Hahella ganghwensis TaxID=286420 RepID=UPI0003727977|nr:DUF2059 domain-containing protein [Hahella ganghwensis]
MKYLLTALFLITFSLSATASDTSKRETVEELLEVMKADAMVDIIYSQMKQMAVGLGQRLGVKKDEQEIFDDYMGNVYSLMQEQMNWEKMKDPIIDVYLKHYTQEEIQGMLDFYKSDTGQSVLKKMPLVVADSTQVSQQMLQEILPQLKQLAQSLQSDLQQARTAQSQTEGADSENLENNSPETES